MRREQDGWYFPRRLYRVLGVLKAFVVLLSMRAQYLDSDLQPAICSVRIFRLFHIV